LSDERSVGLIGELYHELDVFAAGHERLVFRLTVTVAVPHAGVHGEIDLPVVAGTEPGATFR
jgi:hypothetical protein